MGKNYLEHVIEMGGSIAPENPIIFLKPNTAIIGPGAPIQLPVDANPVHHEGELAVVIGQGLKGSLDLNGRLDLLRRVPLGRLLLG